MVKIKSTTLLIYLLVIQELSAKDKVIKNNDLAKILGISPSSVSEMLEKLELEGYLNKSCFQLTKRGKNLIEDYSENIRG
ncbi:hypothetical protein IGI39_001419 [Enterococcus sp. AZ135]|uniref:winged helix-turn-helix transcriptional regulator n=1 Tax=unclassified Enterococcus TaxID=2608891 RepID=UPI003F256E04